MPKIQTKNSKNGLGRAKQYFLGYGFALPRLSFRAGGSGRNARGIRDGKIKFKFQNSYCAFVHNNILDVQTKGVHPRHPPRAFPLGLRVPRCLCAGKQKSKRLKYQEMSRLEFARNFLGRGSFLSPGRDYTLGLPRVFCPRHPHSTFFNIMFSV